MMGDVSFIQGYELPKLDLGLQKLTSKILIHRRVGILLRFFDTWGRGVIGNLK